MRSDKWRRGRAGRALGARPNLGQAQAQASLYKAAGPALPAPQSAPAPPLPPRYRLHRPLRAPPAIPGRGPARPSLPTRLERSPPPWVVVAERPGSWALLYAWPRRGFSRAAWDHLPSPGRAGPGWSNSTASSEVSLAMGTLSLVWGLVLAPMGWVLLLAATATPRWRELPERPGYPRDLFFSDGLWESCVEALTQLGPACRTLPEDTAHFWPLWVLRAAAVGSLLLGALGYALAMLGARWWAPPPRPNLVATAGLLLMLAGAMYLGATSYMAHRVLQDLASPQTPPADRFHLGTCLYLGWSGGGAEVLAGVCLVTSFCRKRGFVMRPAPAPYEVDY